MQAGLNTHRVRRSVRIVAIATLVAAFTGFAVESHAQEAVQARVNIVFAFVADGKDMPAGTYEFSLVPGRVVLRAKDGKMAPVMMTVITRLGRHDADTETELIFDKIDDRSVLSELWIPNSDGYLLVHGTPDHEHRVVGGSKPSKR